MEHYESLKNLLRPMYLYDPDGPRSNGELLALGAALDGVCAPADTLAKECVVPSAERYGLDAYEEILPERPAAPDLAARRAAIMALLQIDETSFTIDALNATLAGCGIAAKAAESGTWYTVTVTFPGTRGVPADVERLQKRIEAILPCHLNVQYVYDFLTWRQLEAAFSSWAALEAGPATWDALQAWPAET